MGNTISWVCTRNTLLRVTQDKALWVVVRNRGASRPSRLNASALIGADGVADGSGRSALQVIGDKSGDKYSPFVLMIG